MRATNHQFNPTNDLSLLVFTVTQNTHLCADMRTMDGILVSELCDGVASTNVNHTLDIEANAHESGILDSPLQQPIPGGEEALGDRVISITF